MRLQGKSKKNYDAAKFIAFVGVAGAGLSIFCYIIYLILFFNS